MHIVVNFASSLLWLG